MLQTSKRFWLLFLACLAGAQSVFAFSIIGPVNEAFQDKTIGFNETGNSVAFANMGGFNDVGAPKNLAEGYRYNTRYIYYAYDASFLDYFGSNGIVEVDKAFAYYNNLAKLSTYSAPLSEFPLNSSRFNHQAAALQLYDLKSAVMTLIAEQIGLAQPDRWTFCLHDRFIPGGAVCPNYTYLVIMRNYDPITQLYDQHVNGVMYGFAVEELCTLNPNVYAPLLADAVEFPTDPTQTAQEFTAIAARNSMIQFGMFYTGLTRDDIGGMRYLMGTNRMNIEAVEPNSQQLFTNVAAPQLLSTLDLSLLTQQAATNNAAVLTGLFPGLIVLQSSNYFSNVITTNITAYFTNFPGSVLGSAPTPVLLTNFSTNVGTFFNHTFGNVVTNHFYTNGYIVTTTTNVGPANPGGVYTGQLVTNVHSVTNFSRFVNGDFYLIPTNALCGSGFQFLTNILTTNVLTTNIFVVATNAPGSTNVLGQNFTFDIVTFFTNYTYVVNPIDCLGNGATVALREGMDKISFIRQDFDSLLGGFWEPVTNFYNLTAVTNGAAIVQNFRRVITAPDFVFDAQDLTSGPGAVPVFPPYIRSTPNYNTAQALNGLAGPGTITPGATFTFNKVGPLFINATGFFISGGLGNNFDTNYSATFQWGSFDGSTNNPVVYPATTSLTALQQQVFFQITNSAPLHASITNNTVANPFRAQLGATGGSGSYTWSLATNSPALPQGFTLSVGGLVSGVPHTQGVYDFIVQATDGGRRTTETDLTIIIGP